ncbi:hypothetical protein DM43_183 [Burkholderia cepacia]|uniref:Uncharacterized protein n=1 Tax=Burkholderia cepacia TaxID=292 RepID=A0AA89CGR4_BURCE|nr:hypothetical protein DM43_183 [Burkholderia cepacia]
MNALQLVTLAAIWGASARRIASPTFAPAMKTGGPFPAPPASCRACRTLAHHAASNPCGSMTNLRGAPPSNFL